MENNIIQFILAITAGLAATLTWVVKKVFDTSERHTKVVENNTKSNDAVAVTLQKVAADLQEHTLNSQPAIEGGKMVGKVIEMMQAIASSLEAITVTIGDVSKSQKDIMIMIKELHSKYPTQEE